MSNVEPKSPLTIIAIFAGIIEASALASLPFLGEDSQGIYTWFLVGFPPFLTVLFFLTLNFNSKTLYSPELNEGPAEVNDEVKTWPTADQLQTSASSAHPPSSTLARLTSTPYNYKAEPGTSTIIVSGTQSDPLIEHLISQAITHHSRLGTLIFHNLETGTQTTLTSHPLPPEPPR